MAKKSNCTKNGLPYFRKTKTVGKDYRGNPVKKEFYGTCEKDVDQQIDEFMNKMESGMPVDYESVTIAMAMHSWLFDVLLYDTNFKSSSFEKHETNFRLYISKSTFSYMPLFKITSLPIQQWYNDLFDSGITTNKIKDINKTLSAFFSYQLTQNMIKYNPCTEKRVRMPGNSELDLEKLDKDNEVLFLSDEEIATINANLDLTQKLDMAILLGLTHMMREGEILGLPLKHTLIARRQVRIRQILTKAKVFNKDGTYKRELRLATPKSKTSIRTIPMVEGVAKPLKDFIKSEEIRHLSAGQEWNENSLLFTTSNFNFWDPKNFRNGWERFLKRIGLPKYKFHILRHTGASLLFRNGASLEEVQEILGHEDSDITKKIYLHFRPEDKRETINKIHSVFFSTPIPVPNKICQFRKQA